MSVSALTPRQREIAGLLARGLPNADIARQLVLTSGTVANHVASILQRLGLDSRTQVAAWAVEHGLYGGQDRLLTVLEQLLDLEPEQISAGLGLVANLVADALSADKVDMFLVDEAGALIGALGASNTALGQNFSLRSELTVPLQLGAGRRGVLTAQSAQPDFFAERDRLFLRAVSRWIALASAS